MVLRGKIIKYMQVTLTFAKKSQHIDLLSVFRSQYGDDLF